MKRLNSNFLALAFLAPLFAVACATATPAQLKSARVAYGRASAGPAAQLTPADLHKAKAALDKAERNFSEEKDTRRTIDLAYVAERTAQLAEARAQIVIGDQASAKATQEYAAQQAAMMKTAQGELRKTREELALSESGQATQTLQTAVEHAAREESDKKAAVSEKKAVDSEVKAKEANDALAKLAAKEDERGLVITLSGSVLFRSNDAVLLPAAMARLDQVSDALVARNHRVVVEGYTDSQGTPLSNLDLSQRRAESVRAYLVGRGFPVEKISARGMGPDRPIAANTSAEGRANNRRVEIVIPKPAN